MNASRKIPLGRSLFLITFATIPAICASIARATDDVSGNMILMNNDGGWSWFMDERAIIDPTNGNLLISSVTASPIAYPTGRPTGAVDVTTFNPTSGSRSTFQLSDINVDDHDDAGLLLLPNGKYLAMYSNHGNTAMGDPLSRIRVSTNAHDATSWTAESTFNWSTTPGWSSNTNPDPTYASYPTYPSNNVSYHNLFYLSAEDQVYDISRGTQQAMNVLKYNYNTNTATWDGQFESSSIPGYGQGYFKFASNGVDKIYFMGTETHPRGTNTSIFAGYISNGKSYKLDGTLMDPDISDNGWSNTSAIVPNISSFTNVSSSQPDGVNGNRTHEWTTDLSLDSTGHPVALFTARGGASSAFTGTPSNGDYSDHRLYYSRYDGTQWVTTELAKMGNKLYSSEEDYTGLGALVPGDPNTVYISTPYDPVSGNLLDANGKHEILKGVTANNGATWTWTAITKNSTVDNIRPIVPAGNTNGNMVLWMRGTYTSAQNYDMTVVGIRDGGNTQTSLVHYVDATASNTVRSTNAALGASTGATETVDQNWQFRTGGNFNGGSVLASGGAGAENSPAIKTTLTGMADGSYNIYAYFWANSAQDWRVQVGLDANNMMLVRDNGAQAAEAAEFDSTVQLTDSTDSAQLYRYFVGEVTVLNGSSVTVFIDDFSAAATTRTWYDGLGYSLAPEPTVASLLLVLGALSTRRRARS
jgi:hypothetical protein